MLLHLFHITLDRKSKRVPSFSVLDRIPVFVTDEILCRDNRTKCSGTGISINRRHRGHQPDDHQYGHNERQHSSHFHRKNTSFF